MDKNKRLEYMKHRFPVLEEVADVVMPTGKQDIKEELDLMDSVREYVRDENTSHELTSDAK